MQSRSRIHCFSENQIVSDFGVMRVNISHLSLGRAVQAQQQRVTWPLTPLEVTHVYQPVAKESSNQLENSSWKEVFCALIRDAGIILTVGNSSTFVCANKTRKETVPFLFFCFFSMRLALSRSGAEEAGQMMMMMTMTMIPLRPAEGRAAIMKLSELLQSIRRFKPTSLQMKQDSPSNVYVDA